MFKIRRKKEERKLNIHLKDILTNRLVIIGSLVFVLFLILVYRLFVLQIVQGEEHLSNFNYKVEKTIETSGSRGNIYDRNGKLLAYNQLAYTVTLEATDKTAELAKKKNDTENNVRNEIIYNLIKLLESNGDSITYDLPLTVDGQGNLRFTESGSALTRFKKDIYGIINIDDLEGEEKTQAEGWMNSTPEEVYQYLKNGENGPSGVGNMFGIADSYSVEDALKIMSIRFDTYMNRYSQTTPVTVASNISDKSIAAISEKSGDFPGISIETNSLRKYSSAKYMSSIIGYTGVISESELEEYNSSGGEYESNDVVGKTGIEKTMESTLQGKKGQQNVLVDNLGKIIKVVNTTESSAGNDVYLTIDLGLQKYAYNTLERRLAGIVLAHLTSNDDAGADKMIPIKDVYYALIDNNVIDISTLNKKKATANEKQVYKIFGSKQKRVLSSLKNELKSGRTTMENLGDEKTEYINYIYDMLKDSGLINTSEIDEDDETYIKWTENKISPAEFFKYAINNEWIDISSFDIASDYYDANEIYNELIKYITDTLKTEEDFDRILYKYMIKNNELSGKRVCLLLFDQGVLDKEKDGDYNSLYKDEMSAYKFMYQKIYKLEITPAQLALDPCSGSIVITDPDTGEVKAMVSYPSYDNNKLANGIDSVYYASLNEDKSSPMLNRCTQTKTAPGSTYKPVSATAALEEGVATSDTYVKCTGVFDEITPNAKCWIYPNAHGSLNVSGAIAVSCNFFFYQMGYNLGSSHGTYDSKRGLDKLKKYASIYGLNRKSGVEITEYDPRISDEDAVRSAIGQGTNSFAPIQISRYVTSLVNQDNLLELSLLEKTTNSKGEEIDTFEKKTDGTMKVSDGTFSLIKRGMINVVNGKDSGIKFLYKNLGVKVAGKTGTAQENKTRPNHALFISYAPYDNPEITTTVVVPNGYTSTNAAEIARDVYKYYFKKTSKKEEKATNALLPTGSDTSND